MQERLLITMKENPDVLLRAIPGHFITPTAHSNYYLDMTAIKSRTHEARAAALELSKKIPKIEYNTVSSALPYKVKTLYDKKQYNAIARKKNIKFFNFLTFIFHLNC